MPISCDNINSENGLVFLSVHGDDAKILMNRNFCYVVMPNSLFKKVASGITIKTLMDIHPKEVQAFRTREGKAEQLFYRG